MPLIAVNDQGDSLFYEESGPPAKTGDLYTTLIIVHGTAFHGECFRRLLPLAPQHQIRLVLVNRRDYPGSTPYTEEDLEKIRVDNAETHDQFAKARAVEFAQFIKTFVENEDVPKASSDWKRGGVVLLAWSSGNSYTLPLLSYIDAIPIDTREIISQYLRSHVMFDAPRWILGLPSNTAGFGVLTDKTLSLEERANSFSEWVSSYYTHKSLTSRKFEDLQVYPVEGPGSKRSTTSRMSPEELRETTCYEAVARSEIGARTGSPAIYAERIRRALFNDELAKYLPRCGVDVVWCENSIWACIDCMWGLQAAREKADDQGIVGRPLRFFMMPGVNHFPHWDDPEMTIKFFADIING
ncbi:uncharacterized protein FOMMEDRAFT_149976 [Fomitiporia mediterranea MF3/22]|uniref:uncharacterized protein n=1 Tax=Fomitiporia mediterranea (strain MF3/22) TaxID=694068 RepID=UPI000440913B|nr:uncharacterized protein FOMMEDRAFT_149976 [Fomitiporia mediterranea MF3/22]EJD07447.1 hypothetical protein FOMMEDRAFT_149976 [Fomitiporia mediterranea MF3/22]